MLFVESRTLSHLVSGPKRIYLLEELQGKALTPALRSARLNCYDHVLSGVERTKEMENAIATWSESENQEAYVQGDLFCLGDHVFFLIFDDDKAEAPFVRAGIVYEAHTPEPFRKLDSFCREVRELIIAQGEKSESGTEEDFPQWEHGKPNVPEGFKRFVAKQDTDSMYTSLRKETMRKRILASSTMEDESTRVFLRRAREAHLEGYASKLLTGDTSRSYEFSIERLEDAGLVEREVQVSCRQTGHALFRLPNAHALAVVTVSDATCSECGSPVADERIEEVIAPTRLASSLLEDGSWLVSRLHYLLRELGVREVEIAVGPSEGTGYGQMMANICGESFLLAARDGDLTPAFARWAIDLEIETEASHLVIVATGRVHNQARVLLLNHARRKVLAGHDFELVLADGATAAGDELGRAFQRVSQRVIAEQLCDLDGSMGLSASQIIITKFQMSQPTEEFKRQDPSNEQASSFSYPMRPLTLAAHASADSRPVSKAEELIQDEATPGHEGDQNIGALLNSETHGS